MEQIDFKKNSINTFRLLASLQVLFEHSYANLALGIVPVLGGFIDFFTGVPVFFTLSGFLIWRSIGGSNSFIEYGKKRFWRIYPELWVAVAVEIVVLLLLYKHPINWPQLGLFTIGQATIFQFWTPDFLRDYGCGCPNGSLWTIAVLIQFYFFAYFVYKLLHNRKLLLWGGVILTAILIGWLTPLIVGILPDTIGKLYNVSLVPYFWMFIISAFVAEFKDALLPVLKRYWWVFIMFLIIKRLFLSDIPISTYYELFDTVLLFCGLVGFSYCFPQINIRTDISYGIYISYDNG